jgi:mono/diheme cytochrome c family protein
VRSWAWLAVMALGGCVACRPATPVGRPSAAALPAPAEAIVRGAPLYAAYCGGCHGPRGDGVGAVALVLGLRPADLRAPELLAAGDDVLVARLLRGVPMTAPTPPTLAEDLQVDALAAYVRTLDRRDRDLLRAGRLVYEGECASCHGVYGDGDGVLSAMVKRPPADLVEASARYSDDALAGVSVNGVGAMPPMAGGFDPGELRALIAYVRQLSKGYRLYDTYCALCHGDDGRGVHPEDLLPPAAAAPPLDPKALGQLSPAVRRAKILHMLRREQGMMPHFQGILDESRLRDIVAYVRMLAS